MSDNYVLVNEQADDKRMSVTFVLDVSGSMLMGTREDHPLLQMNRMLARFLNRCMNNPKISNVCEVSFLLFTDEILLKSGYQTLMRLDGRYFPKENKRHRLCGKIHWMKADVEDLPQKPKIPVFEVSKKDNGTNIGKAVHEAVLQIENRLKELSAKQSFPAFMILISDGNLQSEGHSGYEKNEDWKKLAIEKLLEHTENKGDRNNLIVPIVISVLEKEKRKTDPLKDYVRHFNSGYFSIDNFNSDEKWEFLSQILVKSVHNSTTIQNLAKLNKMMLEDRKHYDALDA